MKVWWLPFLALSSNRPQLPGDVQNNVSAIPENEFVNSIKFSSRPQLPVHLQDSVSVACDNETVFFRTIIFFDEKQVFFLPCFRVQMLL